MSSLGLWYASKAKLYLREAEEYYRQLRSSESIQLFLECIEFASKAICELFRKRYPKKHDISESLEKLAKEKEAYKKELLRLALVSSRWVGMEQRARMVIKFGNQDAKVPATEIVRKEDVELIKADAWEACGLLNRIEVQEKFKPPIKMGILDGYVEREDPQKYLVIIMPGRSLRTSTHGKSASLTLLLMGRGSTKLGEFPSKK